MEDLIPDVLSDLTQFFLDVLPGTDDDDEVAGCPMSFIEGDDLRLQVLALSSRGQDVELIELVRVFLRFLDLRLDFGERDRLVRFVVLALCGPEWPAAARVDEVDTVLPLTALPQPFHVGASPLMPE